MAGAVQQAQLVDPDTDPPSLLGGECAACGHRFFPRQEYGCERCGANGESLRPVRFPATGRLLGAVVIRHHMGRPLDEPFVLARVLVEPGIAVRAVLAGTDEPASGTEVVGVLVEESDGAGTALRFRPVSP